MKLSFETRYGGFVAITRPHYDYVQDDYITPRFVMSLGGHPWFVFSVIKGRAPKALRIWSPRYERE